MTAKKIALLLVCVSLIIIPASFPTGYASRVSTFTLSNLSTTVLTFNLSVGAEINGTITTNSSIRFYVNGPELQPLIPSQIISDNSSFDFTATEAGNYTLSFENGTLNSAKVTVDYDSPGNSSSLLNPFLYFTIALVIVIVVIILLTVRKSIIKRKQKERPITTIYTNKTSLRIPTDKKTSYFMRILTGTKNSCITSLLCLFR